MIVFRRRLIFWLIKAYIKKSGKTLAISFLLGLCIFFGLLLVSKYFVRIIPIYKKVTIGMVGAYTKDNLPQIVVNKLSRGLTAVNKDGTIKPDIAQSWKILDNGKTYVVSLKHGLYFNDGREVTSDATYNFTDVTIEKPDKYTIVFKLKDAYAPFLVTLSRPVIERGFAGVGDYRIENIKLNGNFIQSLTLVSAKDKFDTIRYQFYPTEEALKMAYLLGEVSHTVGLSANSFNGIAFDKFPNTKISDISNYSRLVTLFFNTTDTVLSDKKVRLALTYAIPDSFKGGKKAFLPYPPDSLYYNQEISEKNLDYTHAKLLLSATDSASNSASALPSLTIKTLKKYTPTAKAIAQSWENIGIKTTITEVDSVPENFQVFLGDFNLPKDPDQYTLWHSQQINNITKYKNLRIDKLLEDGRKTVDIEKRKEIYADFQKYLMEDAPAAFLYFPTEYEMVRK